MSVEQTPRIALLNLMPSVVFQQTARQWQGLFEIGGPIEFIPLRFDDDPRLGTGCGSEHLVEVCTPLSKAEQKGIDALIITGANLERRANGSPLPFQDIRFFEPLVDLIDWSQRHSRLTIYSCLASHIALNHLFGIERDIADRKQLGVYKHETRESWLTEGFSSIKAPHSRWGTIGTKLLEGCEIEVVADSSEAGWLLAKTNNMSGGNDVFIQGHPEYRVGDLDKEYKRDTVTNGSIPENYYPQDDPSQDPIYSWELDSIRLFKNLCSSLQSETTD